MPNYNEDQLSDFRDAFTLFDDRGDDKIHKSHLGEVVRALGLNPTEADIKKCLKDLSGDRISFEQFLPIYEDICKKKDQSTEDDFIEGLRVFDKDGSGTINSAELRHLLTTLGERLNDDEVEQLLMGLEDKHGNVNYEEFVKMLLLACLLLRAVDKFNKGLIKCLFLLTLFGIINCDLLLESKLREELKQRPPPSPFFDTGFDKSYYFNGAQRPVYNVFATTAHGRIQGTTYQVRAQSNLPYYYYISAFLGIPYAQSPTGENRFQLPREPEMRQKPLYDATYYRSTCYQDYKGESLIRQHIPNFPHGNFSEDCLFLNIFTPNRTDRVDSKYPVMIFIHGGGFSGGSSQLYNGFVLAQRGIVVVTINYRLGPLGFLSTESKSASGNFGLHDQRMAMKFVYENIDNFNGDRTNITLVGHEAGAASVGIHILSEASRKYFNKAVFMSGSDLCKWSYLNKDYHPLEFARKLSRKLGCYDYDTFKMVQCLRQRNAKEIMSAEIWVPQELGGSPWRPVVDADDMDKFLTFLDNNPKNLRDSGKFYNITVMFGVNSDEGADEVSALRIPNIDTGLHMEKFEEVLKGYVKSRTMEYYKWTDYQYSIKYADSNYYINRDEDFIDEDGIYRALQYRYTNWAQPENTTNIRKELINLYSDSQYVSCVNEAARYHTAKWPNRTYMYVFEHRSTKSEKPHWMGSSHGNELYYLFGVPFFNESRLIPWYGYRLNERFFNEEDQQISNYTMHLFANFMRWSNPTPYGYFSDKYYLHSYNTYNTYNRLNHEYNTVNSLYSTIHDSYTKKLNVTWQPMQPNNLTYLVIRTRPHIQISYRFSEAGFWNYYWLKLWEKRLTLTPTPALRNAVLSYQDSYILVWVFIVVSLILSVLLTFSCFIICRKIKNDKYDEDDF